MLLTGPVGPDGDSLGACLALAAVLDADEVRVTVAGRLPPRYAFLPTTDRIVDDESLEPLGAYDAVVVLDGDRHRLTPPVEAAFAAAQVRGLVDHHASSTHDGYTHVWHEPEAESACSMLYRAFQAWQVPVDQRMASWLYAGIVFDTGGFRHSNTTPQTHRTAAELVATGIDHTTLHARVLAERSIGGARAMGAVLSSAEWDGARVVVGRVPQALQRSLHLEDGDLEGVVECLLHTTGTELAALLIERPDGRVKVSFRSRCDVDVARAARHLTPHGGGHPRAAGAVLDLGLAEAEQAVRRVLNPGDPT
ncbi:MAG: DHH family phosphoesterase [Myxococcales bacterium]|nr:DHH family phosphoesterase [Myxococcales bacterium]